MYLSCNVFLFSTVHIFENYQQLKRLHCNACITRKNVNINLNSLGVQSIIHLKTLQLFIA